VVVCVLAAVLLVLSRRGLTGAPTETAEPDKPAGAAKAAAAPRRSTATRETPAVRAAGEELSTEQPAEPSVEPEAAGTATAVAAPVEEGEPPVEEVEVTDLLLVVDLKDDVFVLDEHPRYHVAECPRLVGHEAIPLPLDEARTDGFTPCGVCSPDRTMAERERARRTGRPTS
jgi:hypothetical protein